MPSFESARMCTLEEYNRHLDDRIVPELVFIGEDYSLMGAVDKWVDYGEAFCTPVRCGTIPRIYKNTGLWVIKFSLLDDDMQPFPDQETVYFKQDGMIELTEDFKKENKGFKEGYLRTYDDGFGNGLRNLYTENQLVNSK